MSESKLGRIIVFAAAVGMSAVMLTSCGRYSKDDNIVYDAIEEYDSGNYEAALEQLQKADAEKFKAMKPENYYFYLGETYFKLGDYEKSLDSHLCALKIKPTLFKSRVTAGVCYSKLGRMDDALKAYEKALEYDPQNADSVGLYISLGSLYISKNKPYTAIDYLEKASEIYPEQPAAHAYLAIAYAMAYEYDRADEQIILASGYGYDRIDEIRERINEIRVSQK
ncbi:MAG: tetratricopeptide repeat protein [Oscillospiraceae bacterium]